MEKGIHFRNKLNRKQRRKFKKNCKIYNKMMYKDYVNFTQFLMRAFVFEDTPQGHEYWMKIIENHTPATKIN